LIGDGGNAYSLTLNGTGTGLINLGAQSNTYSGGTTIGGSASVQIGANNSLGTGATVYMNGGDLSTTAGIYAALPQSLTVGAGDSVSLGKNNGGYTIDFNSNSTSSGTNTIGAGATLTWNGGGSLYGTTTVLGSGGTARR